MSAAEYPIGCSSVEGTVAARRAARKNCGATFHCDLANCTAAALLSRPSLEALQVCHAVVQVYRPSPEPMRTQQANYQETLDEHLLARNMEQCYGLVARKDANTVREGGTFQKWSRTQVSSVWGKLELRFVAEDCKLASCTC
jgi:hypothetical protein